jgi:hypothetical protein
MGRLEFLSLLYHISFLAEALVVLRVKSRLYVYGVSVSLD